MRLSDLHIRCLFAAASRREMIKRDWLLDSMTIVSEWTHQVTCPDPVKVGESIKIEAALNEAAVGQVVCINKEFLGIVYDDKGAQYTIGVLSDVKHPIFHPLNIFQFKVDLAAEFFPENSPLIKPLKQLTTVGRFLENMITIQMPTDFMVFEYINSVWKPDDIVEKMTNALSADKITVEQFKNFVNNFFFLNHITEISVPSMTEKSLMTTPKVQEFKKKFIAEHQGQMHDPLVIKQFEDELIRLDREYLGDDPSVAFFDGLGSKSWEIHRKKLFLAVGGIPAFDTSVGGFDFNPDALVDGWKTEMLPVIANEIRRGSYERGVETAKGGAETKLVMRVFQDLMIIKDDCGTKRTIAADFGSSFRIKEFIGRTINDNGTDVVLTPDNISKYDGKVVRMYSPLTCAEPYHLCYKCCGQRCKDLDVKKIGIQTVKITSKFMNMAMKNMHGTVLKTFSPKLEDILL